MPEESEDNVHRLVAEISNLQSQVHNLASQQRKVQAACYASLLVSFVLFVLVTITLLAK